MNSYEKIIQAGIERFKSEQSINLMKDIKKYKNYRLKLKNISPSSSERSRRYDDYMEEFYMVHEKYLDHNTDWKMRMIIELLHSYETCVFLYDGYFSDFDIEYVIQNGVFFGEKI